MHSLAHRQSPRGNGERGRAQTIRKGSRDNALHIIENKKGREGSEVTGARHTAAVRAQDKQAMAAAATGDDGWKLGAVNGMRGKEGGHGMGSDGIDQGRGSQSVRSSARDGVQRCCPIIIPLTVSRRPSVRLFGVQFYVCVFVMP